MTQPPPSKYAWIVWPVGIIVAAAVALTLFGVTMQGLTAATPPAQIVA